MGRHRAFDRWQERYERIIDNGAQAKKYLKVAKQCGFNIGDKVLFNGEKGYISEVYIETWSKKLNISITAPKKSDNSFPLANIYFKDTEKHPSHIACDVDWENLKLDKSEIERYNLKKKRW